jgi:hypothetical protein
MFIIFFMSIFYKLHVEVKFNFLYIKNKKIIEFLIKI